MKTISDKSVFVTILLFLTATIVTLSLLFPKFGIVMVICYGLLYVVLPIIFMAIKPERFTIAGKWLWNLFLQPILSRLWWLARAPMWLFAVICFLVFVKPKR